MWIVLIMVTALANAAGIHVSRRLGAMDWVGARQAAHVGLAMSSVFLLVVGSLVLINIRAFGLIFTSDEEFLGLLEQVRLPLTLTLVLMNLAVAIERIPYSMGRTKEVFWYGFVASWGAQVPAVYVLIRYWRDDLTGLYWGMTIGYGVLCGLYAFITFTRYV